MYEQLRERFEAKTRERFVAMRENLAAMNRGKRDAIDGLFRDFHALTGLGSTFGRPAITQLASIGERALLEFRQNGSAPAAADLDRWNGLVDEMESALAFPVVAEKPKDSSSASSSHFDILLVTDSPELAALVERLVQPEGYSLRVTGPSLARAAMKSRLPNALIASAGFADGSGYDVVRELRELPATDGILTAVVGLPGEPVDRVEAIRCGSDVVFDAPLDTKALLRRLAIAYQTQCGPSARILIVEDEPEQAAILESILQSGGYETRTCGVASEVSEAVSAFQPDLILLDIHLPGGMTGHEIVRLLRQDERHATTPVVFVTTEAGISSILGTIKAGGDDHLVKPVQPAMLLTVVNSRLQRAQLLRALVDRDGLTGLLTHGTFRQQLEHAAEPQRRGENYRTALVMIDVDHFKSVNDRFGHRTGDRVLGALGAFLRRKLRQSDAIARYGGEEFALLLRNLSEDDSTRLVRGLLEEFSTVEHQAPAETFRVNFSAGVAMLESIASGRPDDWIEAADRALYEAKRQGRARVVAAPMNRPAAVA